MAAMLDDKLARTDIKHYLLVALYLFLRFREYMTNSVIERSTFQTNGTSDGGETDSGLSECHENTLKRMNKKKKKYVYKYRKLNMFFRMD